MSGKIKVLVLVAAGAIVLIAGLTAVSEADAPVPDIPVKARFLSGFGLDVHDQYGLPIPNKVLNDIEGAHYQSAGPNSHVVLHKDSGSNAYYFCMYLTTDRKCPRFVNLHFDAMLVPPGTGLKSACANDYFIDRGIAPIETTWFWMTTAGEWELIPDPSDGLPILNAKENTLDLVTMTDGQAAYTYIFRYMFHVRDDKSSSYREDRDTYSLVDCQWGKIVASDWDGQKVNTWTVSAVTEPFKHKALDGSGAWCDHPEGAIPHPLISNAYCSCYHGTYRMPWQLEITRRP